MAILWPARDRGAIMPSRGRGRKPPPAAGPGFRAIAARPALIPAPGHPAAR